jgi:hypothetical protein
MENNNVPVHLQEIIFASSDSLISRQITKLLKEGKIRKLAPRLYSGNLIDAPEKIIRRNIFFILGKLYPGSVLSHRSALEFKVTNAGNIFLTYTYSKKIELPGITICFLKGQGPIDGDNILSGQLFVSQRERALLENLQISKTTESESKSLSLNEIEDRLEQIISINGEEALNKTRDTARIIAEKLGFNTEFNKLNKIIGALLSTKSANILNSELARSRAFGLAYDPLRNELFGLLFAELSKQEFKYFDDKNQDLKSFSNFAFFESYFSNFIEGTVFELEEAIEIIDTQTPIPSRNADSHDILGTYKIVSNKIEMSKTPKSPEELIEILKYRHQLIMASRTDKKPGAFKDKNNFAGQTTFVDFSLVRGTLYKCYEYYNALNHPFSKAAFIMFAISEIHPFLDGNGRISRVMMNAELTSAGQSKIIIPTVYREDYILALRKLSRQKEASVYIRMLSKIHQFSSSIFGDFDLMKNKFMLSNAFLEPSEGKLQINT